MEVAEAIVVIIILMTVIPLIIDSMPAKTAKVPKNKIERTAFYLCIFSM